MDRPHPRVACFATQGGGSDDEARVRALVDGLDAELLPFDRASRAAAVVGLVRALRRAAPDVVVMEGTGVAGGVAVLVANALFGTRYVVSSGDAVGPYVALRSRALAPVAGAYERLLYRRAAGFVGWSPYLTGRAVELGARRAMTAPGWAPHPPADAHARSRVRAALGIGDDDLVFGIAGSLHWNAPRGYCYGAELVRAVQRTDRPDVRVLIVGDGSGRAELERLAGRDLGGRVLLTGRVPREEIPSHLAAMDVGSLPQSVDRLGALRYTTKLSEYLGAGLPVVTGRLPLAYDLDDGWLWRLPGASPWDPAYIAALTTLMATLGTTDIRARAQAVPRADPQFDRARQQARTAAFLRDVVADAA
jgi:hypothetical protein